MSDVHIAGTGIWFPEDIITNDESFTGEFIISKSEVNQRVNEEIELLELYINVYFRK